MTLADCIRHEAELLRRRFVHATRPKHPMSMDEAAALSKRMEESFVYQTYTISDRARYLDPETCSDDDLAHALTECHVWDSHYPEDDDYALVSWLQARCNDQIERRALAKISGGVKPPMVLK